MINNQKAAGQEVKEERNGFLRHLAAFFIASFAFVIFVIVFIFSSNTLMTYIVSSRGVVVVPDLTGTDVETATSYLSHIDLKIEVIDSEYHEFSEGLIVAQLPSIGRQIYKNRTIQVITSRGSKIIVMPELRGVSFQSVNEILRSYELRLGNVSQHYSNDVPAGSIIGTVPSSGTDTMAGIEVNVILSIGRDPLDPIRVEPPPQFQHPLFDELFEESIF